MWAPSPRLITLLNILCAAGANKTNLHVVQDYLLQVFFPLCLRPTHIKLRIRKTTIRMTICAFFFYGLYKTKEVVNNDLHPFIFIYVNTWDLEISLECILNWTNVAFIRTARNRRNIGRHNKKGFACIFSTNMKRVNNIWNILVASLQIEKFNVTINSLGNIATREIISSAQMHALSLCHACYTSQAMTYTIRQV